MNGFERRLDRLEVLWGPYVADDQTAEQDAEEERHIALNGELISTMDEAHVIRLVDYLRLEDTGERPADEGARRLLEVFNELVGARLGGRTNFALALPGEIATVYLTDPTASPFEQCRSCLVTLPTGSITVPWRGGGQEVRSRSWFASCPECGGAVGAWDKWRNGSTLQTPEEKRVESGARYGR